LPRQRVISRYSVQVRFPAGPQAAQAERTSMDAKVYELINDQINKENEKKQQNQ